jgi:hypothetical protein
MTDTPCESRNFIMNHLGETNTGNYLATFSLSLIFSHIAQHRATHSLALSQFHPKMSESHERAFNFASALFFRSHHSCFPHCGCSSLRLRVQLLLLLLFPPLLSPFLCLSKEMHISTKTKYFTVLR